MAEALMFTDIRVRRDLPGNRKIRYLRARFGLEAIGALVMLWLRAADKSPVDGCLGLSTPEDLALDSGYGEQHPERAEEFGRYLIDHRFVDQREDGSWVVHDWSEGQGFLASAPDRKALAKEYGSKGGKASAEVRKRQTGTAQPRPKTPNPPLREPEPPPSGTPKGTLRETEADPSTKSNLRTGPDRTGPKSGPSPSPSVSRESPGSSPLPSPLPSATAPAPASSPGSTPPRTRRALAATKLHIRRGLAVSQGKPDPGPPTPEQIESLAATLPPGEDDPDYRGPAVSHGG